MAAPGQPTGAAILVAAGSGQRLGADVPKAFITLGGRTLLEHAVARFLALPPRLLQRNDHDSASDPVMSLQESRELSVLVVAPADYVEQAARLTGLPVVAGGVTRQDSVAAGLAALGADVEFVLVHDVARPFVPARVIDAVLAALADGADAVVPVVAVHDTIRTVERDGTLGGLVDRSSLVAIQTPQGFRRTVLADAHRRGAGAAATDDAGLVEAIGGRVVAVPGAEESFKITTPADLMRAQAYADTLTRPA